jgi:hypothetical protein
MTRGDRRTQEDQNMIERTPLHPFRLVAVPASGNIWCAIAAQVDWTTGQCELIVVREHGQGGTGRGQPLSTVEADTTGGRFFNQGHDARSWLESQ